MLVNGITSLNCKCSGQQKAFQNNRVNNQNQPTFKAWSYERVRHFSYWFMDWIKSSPSPEEIAVHLKKIEYPHFKKRRETDINYLKRLLREKANFKDIGTTEIDTGRKYSSDFDYEMRNPGPEHEGRLPGMPESD